MKFIGEYLLGYAVIILMFPVFLVGLLIALFESGRYVKMKSM